MSPSQGWLCVALACLIAGVAAPAASETPSPAAGHWVGSWGADPTFPTGPSINRQTIRQVVRLSIGGRKVRLRLSNELGAAPLAVEAARLARPGAEPGSIDPASDRVVTFGGRPFVVVPPGAPALSDPVDIDAKPLDRLAISLFIGRDTGPTASHPLGMATAYLVPGDQTGNQSLTQGKTGEARLFLSGVDVEAPEGSAVVAFGDSITDGSASTPDADRRWPDVLAERLAQVGRSVGVVDAGISGNRVLHDRPEDAFGPSALARFDRDVLSVPGVRTVIVMESINDIGHSGSAGLPEQAVSARDIIGGLDQLVERAHAQGIRVLGATLTPYADTVSPGYYTAEGEAKRQAVNQWIRESRTVDGVIDFDVLLRDPARPDHLQSRYDSGDHLHPNDAGYRVMGEAVDLDLLAP